MANEYLPCFHHARSSAVLKTTHLGTIQTIPKATYLPLVTGFLI